MRSIIVPAYYIEETYMTKRGGFVTKSIPYTRDHEPLQSRKSRLPLVSTSMEVRMEDLVEVPARLRVLHKYAELPDSTIATKLPPTVYFSHTQHTLTIFDAYPKALFHFLVLPRLSRTVCSTELKDLATLLRRRACADADMRTRAQETLRVLADEAARMRGVIEEEMRARYGFVWEIWTGFHAVPSMESVVSQLRSDALIDDAKL